MLNIFFVIERAGKFAVELDSDFQIWSGSINRAIHFKTHSDAAEFIGICRKGSRIVLKTAATTVELSIPYKTESIVAPIMESESIAERNEKLETARELELHISTIPESMRDFTIFQYIPDNTSNDPGPLPEGY